MKGFSGTVSEWIGRAIHIIRRDCKGYILINVIYFGSLLVGISYAFYDPQVQSVLHEVIIQAYEESFMAPVAQAYLSENWFLAFLLTFLVNLCLGSFVVLTLPSIPIFFAGLLLAVYRAILWGVAFSPTSPFYARALAVALPVIILEGEAYCLATWPSLKTGLSWLFPRRVYKEEALNRKQAFVKAARELAVMYVIVALVLLIAAAVEVIVVSITKEYMRLG
jgi:uncharacterized membrane protein SpoIIM required for sporulation